MRALLRRPALLIALTAFVIYNLNLRPMSSGDSAPTALLPLAIWLDGTVTLDRYAPWLEARYATGAYFLVRKGGHYYSSYPLALPLLLTPLYSPLALASGLRAWPPDRLVLLARMLEKLAASLVAAAAVGLFYRLARRFTDARRALWLTVVFGFATSMWSISSQALWQHGMGQLLIIASLLCLERGLAGAGGRLAWAGAGLCAALSMAVRPTNVLFLAACAGVLAAGRRWRLLGSYVLFGAAIGAAVGAYNLAVFGRLSGWYGNAFGGSLAENLAGLLFSPGRGLFVYSPVLLLVFPALGLWLRRRAEPAWPAVAVAALFAPAHTVLHAAWVGWWAGDCFGPRYVSEALPCLVLLLAPLLECTRRRRAAKITLAALAALSVSVQFVGAFCYPRGQWNNEPVPVGRALGRLWDWRDNPIWRELSAGVDFRGYGLLATLCSGGLESLARELDRGGYRLQ